jgi:hypothetical protein
MWMEPHQGAPYFFAGVPLFLLAEIASALTGD